MKKIMIFLSFALVLMIVACNIDDIDRIDNIDRIFNPSLGNNLELTGSNSVNFTYTGTDELKKFNSKQELMDFLKQGQSYNSYDSMYYGGMRTVSNSMAVPAMADMAVSKESSSAASGNGASATDYSTTNIQVEGVDEADFVKNDGKYIYMISGNSLVIVDAFPADKADIISETDLKGYPRELFINKDRLVVFTENNEESLGFMQYDIVPRPIYKQKTHAYVYDISDRKDPKIIKDYDVKGNYQTSRMIGDYVYTIVQDNVYYYGGYLDTPVIRESSKAIVSPEIYYFDVPDSNYNFNTVMSFNLKDEEEKPVAETYMMGYSSVIYVSENNIYISYQKNMPYSYYDRYNEQRFYDVVVPLLPDTIKEQVKSIQKDDSIKAYEKWDKVSGLLEEMYNKMDDTEKEDYITQVQDAITEYEVKREEEMRKTVIHKIGIKNGKLDYIARGEVKGYLLNQFSMDENDDKLRVATTFETWANDKNVQYNNVYVLDSDMKLKGKLEKIAPDERIYSTRFLGNRLYMVTFKRMDPFFVIDLSKEDPKVLGKLKIPGFSDYLHPYDETHIIGLGKETAENEWGGISTKGIKLALFDVSDVENPIMVDKYDIGEAGSDSEALNEHKAFLFDKEKNLLVIPVRLVKGTQAYDSRYGYYRQKIWQGAYAFTVTDKGFELKGKVSHGEEDEYNYWYYGSPNAIRRSLFMDNVLYTISMKKVMMNKLSDLEEIDTINLPYTETNYPYPMYTKGGMMVE